jgi:hypothetical protein
LIFDALIKVSVGRTGDAVQFESGMIDRTPWPRVNAFPAALGDLARSIWSSYRELDRSNEVSPAFELPTLLRVTKSSFGSAVSAADKFYRESIRAISQNQDDLDELCFRLYNVSDTDRKALTTDAAVMVESHSSASDEIDIANKDQVDDSQVVTAVTPQRYAASLTSWAVGVALGRFDIRLATGERKYPEAPEPFDPLDMCPAGMLTSAAGVPLEVAPPGYPVEISPILVDDPGHPADITARLRRVFDVVFGDHADRWWIDVGSVLGGRDGEISAWLAKGLFAHHLDIYHVPRSRQAPIFWPIGTRSGSYLVWMYAHRISADSLFLILNDLVAPKLLAEERRLSQLRQEAGPGGTASQRRAIDVQDRLVDEIRELRELLQAVAPLWAPDLNDGVVIVLAPLWRLFAHHRAWSSELKKHWVKLSRGDFDWAQLAMHLWPDRVVPKCAEDRSIAIAHGLEEVFWVADPANKDKWTRRKTPVIPMEELIAQHRNPAVSAALERMGNQ